MEPTFVNLQPFTVVGLAIRTEPMSPDISALWPRFISRIPEITALAEPRVGYGVVERLARMAELGATGQGGTLRYLAAVSVADGDAALPDGMTAMTVPGGLYAEFSVPMTGIAEAIDHIFRTWLPASGFDLAAPLTVERYGEDFDPADPAARLQVRVPVVARGGPR